MKRETSRNEKSTAHWPSTREEARAQGLNRYFSGVPCKRGHIEARYVSTNQCVKCQGEHARRLGGWKARPSKEGFLQRVRDKVEKEWGGRLLSSEYIHAKSDLNIRCPKGHLFSAKWSDLNRKRNQRCPCPDCKQEKHSQRMHDNLRTVEELKKFARIEHEGDCLATSPVPMNTKVFWKCKNPLHEKFLACVSNVFYQRNWCRECDRERRRLHPPRLKISRKAVESLLKERGIEIIAPLEVDDWPGSKTRLTVRCADGHLWDAEASNLIYAKSGCPECRRRNGEQITRAIFEATFGSEFPSCCPPWLEGKKGRSLELDGYCESLKLAFEYQGPHHFTEDDVRERDALKREACLKQGVKLVEVEWAKKPFPQSNVLENVARALLEAGIGRKPIMPQGNLFPGELAKLQRFAKEEWGGSLVSTVYSGSETPHEWRCSNPDHPTWRAEPCRVKKRGHWCPACAGNRRLGLDGLRSWGERVGLELVDEVDHATDEPFNWRCKQAQHLIRRRKGDIEESLKKGHPACSQCGRGRSVNVLAIKKKAEDFAASVQPIIIDIVNEGPTAVARRLNERHVRTRTGKPWSPSTVKNLLDRLNGLSTERKDVD